MAVWRVTCGTAKKDLKCIRPSWDTIKEAYEEINEIYGGSNNEAVFFHIFNIRGRNNNSCALRMSYALNNSGVSIKQKLSKPNIRINGNIQYNKSNGYKYIMGAAGMSDFLNSIWGKADKSFNKQELDRECIKWLQNHNKNGLIVIRFYYKAPEFTATGHTTLWYGDKQCFGDYKEVGVSPYATRTLTSFFEDNLATKFEFWEL